MKYTVSLFLLIICAVALINSRSVVVAQEIEIPIAVSEAAPEASRERKAAARIVTTSGICSATKLGPKTVLTSSHCFDLDSRVLLIGDYPAIIEAYVVDGNDHALVMVSEVTLKDFAVLGPPPKEGTNIHYWGNPHVFTMLLRRGYVSGFDDEKTLYDVNGFHGDSGAGIFDEKNRLVGVISYIQGRGPFSMMGSYPLNFTAEQIDAVGLKPNPLLMSGIKVPVVLRK